MSLEIDRFCIVSEQGVITSNETTTATQGFGSFAGGLMYVTSTSTGSAITVSWRSRFSASSAIFKLHDSSNSPITTTIQAGRAYELPQEIFGALQVMAVADTAGQSAVVRFSTKG